MRCHRHQHAGQLTDHGLMDVPNPVFVDQPREPVVHDFRRSTRHCLGTVQANQQVTAYAVIHIRAVGQWIAGSQQLVLKRPVNLRERARPRGVVRQGGR